MFKQLGLTLLVFTFVGYIQCQVNAYTNSMQLQEWEISEITEKGRMPLYTIRVQHSDKYEFEELENKWLKFITDSVSVFIDLEEEMIIVFEKSDRNRQYKDEFKLSIPDSILEESKTYILDSSISKTLEGLNCQYSYVETDADQIGENTDHVVRHYCLKPYISDTNIKNYEVTDFVVRNKSGYYSPSERYQSCKLIHQRI